MLPGHRSQGAKNTTPSFWADKRLPEQFVSLSNDDTYLPVDTQDRQARPLVTVPALEQKDAMNKRQDDQKLLRDAGQIYANRHSSSKMQPSHFDPLKGSPRDLSVSKGLSAISWLFAGFGRTLKEGKQGPEGL